MRKEKIIKRESITDNIFHALEKQKNKMEGKDRAAFEFVNKDHLTMLFFYALRKNEELRDCPATELGWLDGLLRLENKFVHSLALYLQKHGKLTDGQIKAIS